MVLKESNGLFCRAIGRFFTQLFGAVGKSLYICADNHLKTQIA